MTTPAKSLTTLEYDKVIARLATHCQTAPGKALALALEPSAEYGDVLRRQRLTAEARRLLELKPNIGMGAAHDVRTIVHQAGLGHVLEPGELLDVQVTLALSRTVREAIDRLRTYIPYLGEIADRIADFRELTAEIARCISQQGEVVDGASPVLARLRREARLAHDRLSARLQQVLKSARSAIQEPIVTLRDGRYVVPVKAELRSQLPGIVHDVSSSGATVFLEPLEVVEMGNHWRELLAEEQREIARILRDLSARAGERAHEITAAIEALAEIDLALAKARLGEAMGATHLPHDGPEQRWLSAEPGSLFLLNARHPLLAGNAVPVTVWLGEGGPSSAVQAATAHPEPFTVLLITGPNTGGKTVALKTVGLLALMAQAGLPVPADADSRLPVFDAVFADIGDEQSIEQSLSTFSSHVGNIVAILRAATDRSLVLMDELAAGTDPVEGAALAKGILSHLLATGCLTVATTHHGELKAFAHVTPGITNSSVEFDPETLSPTYRLIIGLPGQSNALAIAERLGMPADILAEARAGIDPDRLAVESLISDLHRHREEAETSGAAQRAAAQEAERARARVTKELTALEANRDRLIERTRKEMEAELQQARLRLREALKEMQRAERLTVFERAAVVETAQQEVAAVEEQAKAVSQRQRKRRRVPLPPIAAGDRIFLQDVPTPGEALSPPDAEGGLDVQLGSLRARINVKQIGRVEKAGADDEAPSRRQYEPSAGEMTKVSPELDLRGLTVDEALALTQQRLDEAALAGVGELRIIHGKGTGTLRRAIRDMLRKHTLVRGHAAAEMRAGGDGVTVVEIAG
ncbi:MAG: endonuclease MutS2 [Dehalococcoidia bacterium]|nr:endonuclease MutS2 [Dehalococcoidia bacterium]